MNESVHMRATAFRLNAVHYEILDRLAAQRQSCRSEVVRHLIENAPDVGPPPAPACADDHREWSPALGGKVRKCSTCGAISRNNGSTWEAP